MEPVPDSEYLPDAEETGTDSLEPVPAGGRDAQTVVGSSDEAAALAVEEPLREAVYVEEQDLPFVDEEAEELEDEAGLLEPEVDRPVNRSIEEADAARRCNENETDPGKVAP